MGIVSLLPSLWVPGIKVRPSVLVASALNQCLTVPTLHDGQFSP